MSAKAAKGQARDRIGSLEERLIALSHRIHANPELAFEEHESVRAIRDALSAEDVGAEVGAYGLPTALEARIGTGDRVVALVAEYDALPGMGHACGHNIIAAAAVGAFLGLVALADDLPFQLRLIGAPAEEGGGGKIELLEAGAFDDVEAALMVHPGAVDLAYMPTLATARFAVTFEGEPAHASAFPERGVNAADAATISQVAIGLLRQQLTGDSRIHGIITGGGESPNVIPGRVTLDYMVRCPDHGDLDELTAKLRACFDAGSIASGARLVIEPAMPAYYELRHDPELTGLYQSNAEALGRRFRAIDERVRRAAGSTDMGNVSHATRAIHPMVGLGRQAGTIHTPEFAEAAVSALGDRALLDGALALAMTVIDFAAARGG